ELIQRIVAEDLQLISIRSESEEIYFFGISKKNISPKKILKYLNNLKEKFCNIFEKEIKNFRGNVSNFKDVEKIINISEDPANFLGIKLDKKTSQSILKKL
ncbi:MAG: hypothetical protein ACTSR3_21685, partial [Candidatus Helarchaeota archaeon]